MHSIVLVIGYAKNTYVGINKNKGATKGLMNLSKPNILLKDEPNPRTSWSRLVHWQIWFSY